MYLRCKSRGEAVIVIAQVGAYELRSALAGKSDDLIRYLFLSKFVRFGIADEEAGKNLFAKDPFEGSSSPGARMSGPGSCPGCFPTLTLFIEIERFING